MEPKIQTKLIRRSEKKRKKTKLFGEKRGRTDQRLKAWYYYQITRVLAMPGAPWRDPGEERPVLPPPASRAQLPPSHTPNNKYWQ